MRRPDFIARQARCPTGLLGQLLGRVMSVETAPENKLALELLELKPGDHILEVGFGHGRTLERAARAAPEGFVAGVDGSERMVRMASQRNRRSIEHGRVELKLADSSRIPYPDRRFDKVYSVHTLYFWSDPKEHLREIHRVMKEGARFVLGFRSREDERAVAHFPATIYRFYTSDEVRIFLQEAGLERIQRESRRISSRIIDFVVAHRAAPIRISSNREGAHENSAL